jgi:hypothetical protein
LYLKDIVTHSNFTFLQAHAVGIAFLRSFSSSAAHSADTFVEKFMEYWPSDISISSSHSVEQRSIRGPRPLKAVSGNRQNFGLDRHASPENQNPQELYYINSSFTETKYPPNTIPTTATHGSNDIEHAAHRLHHRQHVSLSDPRHQEQIYMNSEKYQGYRARQRKDLGQDNKQVWSDDVEEAFQEGPVLSTQILEVLTRASTFGDRADGQKKTIPTW